MSDTFKQEKLKDFTVIRNAIFKDCNLSAKAKGVACQLLSLPPSWDYSIRGLATMFNDGEASISSALSELEEAGYLRREQTRSDGKFSKSRYVVADMLKCEKPFVEKPYTEKPYTEKPIAEKPYTEKPYTEKPIAENRPQLNTKELNTKELNTKELNTNKSNTERLYTLEFERLWELYPRKQGKKDALKHYLKARKDGTSREEIEKGIIAYANYLRATNTEERYIKHGSTFFSQQAWQDEWRVSNGGNDFGAGTVKRTGMARAPDRIETDNGGVPFRYPGMEQGKT